jgi:predicted dehydrogenase
LPEDLSPYQVVMTVGSVKNRDQESLTLFVHRGGGWLAAIDASNDPLPAMMGVILQPPGPRTELRILFENADHPIGARLPDAIYAVTCFQALIPADNDTETILYADWHYSHQSVMTLRRVYDGKVACTTLQAYDHPVFQQICYRMVIHLAGRPLNADPLGVGILGYAPSVGQLHGLGICSTHGLDLRAVCDLSEARCEQAQQAFPGIRVLSSSAALAAVEEIDLVIVATPPSIHADNCLEMMAAGMHVVCEKPLALNCRETDALQDMAERNQVHLSCHQNRRWDPDYLTIRDCLEQGQIGELFYLETFVGGFHHPCGYWHSHAAVSGGTAYDWGAHYLDWIVSLIQRPVTAVIGTRHKRVWQDVTNADQERIQIRFDGGVEAEFIHSDIAAARKPKWYLLGTQGAVVGHWKDVDSYSVDPVHYYARHPIPATEMPPELTIFKHRAEDRMIRINPDRVAREPYAFHRNLADHLLIGEPITAPLADSVAVVRILEAAARSMERGGTVEVIDGD